MKVIISGANGFLGQNLVNECCNNGIEVVAILRKNPIGESGDYSNCLYVTLQEALSDKAVVEKMQNADFFFHFAWVGTSGPTRKNVDEQIENLAILEKCMRVAALSDCKKFINAGSIMEAEMLQRWSAPSANYQSTDVYSVLKITSDYLGRIKAAENGIDYINLVISNIYGPGERSERFINSVLKKMINNIDISLSSCTQLYDFIYITDAVKAIMKVAEGGKSGNYYIGNAEQKPLKDFVIKMQEVTKTDSKLLFGDVMKSNKDLVFSELDCSRIYNELGFVIKTSFTEGIRKTVDYLKGEL